MDDDDGFDCVGGSDSDDDNTSFPREAPTLKRKRTSICGIHSVGLVAAAWLVCNGGISPETDSLHALWAKGPGTPPRFDASLHAIVALVFLQYIFKRRRDHVDEIIQGE